MDKKTTQKYIKQYITRIKKDLKNVKIIIYGSYLTKRFKKQSDIDLLVISERFKTMDEDERLRLLYNKTRGLPLDFHIYGLSPEETKNVSPLSTLNAILKKGFAVN